MIHAKIKDFWCPGNVLHFHDNIKINKNNYK